MSHFDITGKKIDETAKENPICNFLFRIISMDVLVVSITNHFWFLIRKFAFKLQPLSSCESLINQSLTLA